MSKIVVKFTLTADLYTNKQNVKVTNYKHIYDVDSIGKRVNCTLRSEASGDIKKRLNKEEFGVVQKDSSFNTSRTSIMYLIENENEVNDGEVFEKLYEAILENLNNQIERFTNFRNGFVEGKAQIKTPHTR